MQGSGFSNDQIKEPTMASWAIAVWPIKRILGNFLWMSKKTFQVASYDIVFGDEMLQKQCSIGVPIKRCFEHLHQVYLNLPKFPANIPMKRCFKNSSKFTREHPCRALILIKLHKKSDFRLDALLWIWYRFLKHIFKGKPLEDYFWKRFRFRRIRRRTVQNYVMCLWRKFSIVGLVNAESSKA